MKYRDLLTVFLSIIFILIIAFTVGVNQDIWYVPILYFFVFIYFIYKLWIGD